MGNRFNTDLSCDFVEGDRRGFFTPALPDSEYVVWLVADDSEATPPLFEV